MAAENCHHPSNLLGTTINQDQDITETISSKQPKTSGSKWDKYLNYQGYWLENTRGNLMIVATVIASMAFQAAMNPPTKDDGDDSQCIPRAVKDEIMNKRLLQAGNLAISCINKYNDQAFIVCNTISFSASFTIIFLLTALPLRNRFSLWVLLVTISITLFFTSATYIVSISIAQGKSKRHQRFNRDVVLYYMMFWVVLVLLVVVFLLLRVLFRLLIGVFDIITRRKQKKPAAMELPATSHV